jgi:hypothetical protein
MSTCSNSEEKTWLIRTSCGNDLDAKRVVWIGFAVPHRGADNPMSGLPN